MSARRTIGLFLVSAVLFGGTFVAAKFGLAHLPPLIFVALRFDIGALVLVGYAAHRLSFADLRPRSLGDVVAILSTGVLVIGLTNASIFVGQQYTTSGVAAIVMSLNPILTMVFAALALSDERLTRRGVVGMFAGLVGVALVANPDPSTLAGSAGLSIIFAAAVLSALGAVTIRWADPTMSSTARTVWGVPIAAVVTHFLSFVAGEPSAVGPIPPAALLALAFLGIGSGAVAYLTYFALIDAAGATRANLLFYFTPVVSALGGWFLLNETISPLTVLGFAVIFAGFLLVGSASIASTLASRRPRTWARWVTVRSRVRSTLHISTNNGARADTDR
ncbi:DMT family transporter [Halobaculum limi]|uniref:DMT family transporter n=1 Tax=Halobaculum limi TaxID=3031916 RepID=UPI002404923E|nr:DMT family transporter [Halobaculum sp. YSMS11]